MAISWVLRGVTALTALSWSALPARAGVFSEHFRCIGILDRLLEDRTPPLQVIALRSSQVRGGRTQAGALVFSREGAYFVPVPVGDASVQTMRFSLRGEPTQYITELRTDGTGPVHLNARPVSSEADRRMPESEAIDRIDVSTQLLMETEVIARLQRVIHAHRQVCLGVVDPVKPAIGPGRGRSYRSMCGDLPKLSRLVSMCQGVRSPGVQGQIREITRYLEKSRELPVAPHSGVSGTGGGPR